MTYPPPPPPPSHRHPMANRHRTARRRVVTPRSNRTAIWCGASCARCCAVCRWAWCRSSTPARFPGCGRRAVTPRRRPPADNAKKWAIWGASRRRHRPHHLRHHRRRRRHGLLACDAPPLARRAGGSRRRGGGRVRGRLAGEPDRARRDSAGVPDQGAAGHRLSGLRQPADDLLAAPSRLVSGGATTMPWAGRGAAAAVGVRRVDLRQAGGAAGAQLAAPAMVGTDGRWR